MDLVIQLWAGGFYFFNKVYFAIAETKQGTPQRRFKMLGWICYLFGVWGWIAVLAQQHNWIAVAVQSGVIPTMLLGLYNTSKADRHASKFFQKLVSLCTYTILCLGVTFSLYEHKGLISFTQILELGVMIGFMIGSYLLSNHNPRGWYFYVMMHIAMGWLMGLQGKDILMIQQIISLCFAISAIYIGYRKRGNTVNPGI